MPRSVKRPKKNRRNKGNRPQNRRQVKRRKKPELFRPLAKGFKTERELNKAVRQRAAGYYKPGLQDLKSEARTETRRHEGRASDIQSMGQSYSDRLAQAYQDTQSALNTLVAQSTTANQTAQENMIAALQATGEEDAGIAGMIGGGVAVPEGGRGAMIASGIAGQGAQDQAHRHSFASLIGGAARQQSIGGLNALRSLDSERMRTSGVHDELRDKRLDIRSRIPEFREKARKEILGEETQKQNVRFQQGLARDEFGLKRRQTRQEGRRIRQEGRKINLAEQQFGWQKQVDLQNIQLQRDQLNAEIEAARRDARGGGPARAERLEQLGKRYDSAIQWLDSYMQPTDREIRLMNRGKINRPQRSVTDVYRRLIGVNRLPKPVALKIIAAQPNKAWRRWANIRLGKDINLTFQETIDKFGFDPGNIKKRLKPLRSFKR